MQQASNIPPGDEDWIFGYKRITPANFTTDDTNRGFAPNNVVWMQWFQEIQLDATVPEAIHKLFEVARGTMIYGWLYYPLLTLGGEQCLRIIEAAARAKAVEMGIQDSSANALPLNAIVNRLIAAGVIPSNEKQAWDAGRELRNIASHPETQTLILPGTAHMFLRRCAEQVNGLFA